MAEKKKGSIHRKLAFLLCILILGIIFITTPPGEWLMRESIQYAVSSFTPYRLDIEDLRIDILFRLRIRGFILFTDRDSTTPLFRIKNVTIYPGFQFPSVFEFGNTRILLDSPAVNIFPGLFKPDTGDAHHDSLRQPGIAIPALPVKSVLVRNGRLSWFSADSGWSAEITDFFSELERAGNGLSLKGKVHAGIKLRKTVQSFELNGIASAQFIANAKAVSIGFADIITDAARLRAEGTISMDSSSLNLSYQLSGDGASISRILASSPLKFKTPELNGNVRISGNVIGPFKKPIISYDGNIAGISSMSVAARDLAIIGNVDIKRAVFDSIKLQLYNGSVYGAGSYGWSGANSGFSLNGGFNNVSLQNVLRTTGGRFQGMLGGTFSLEGKSINPARISGRGKLKAKQLLINNISLDTMDVQFSYRQGTVNALAKRGDDSIAVSGSLYPEVGLQTTAEISDSLFLRALTGQPLRGNILVKGDVLRHENKWSAHSTAFAGNLEYRNLFFADSVFLRAEYETDSESRIFGMVIRDSSRIKLSGKGDLNDRTGMELYVYADTAFSPELRFDIPDAVYLRLEYIPRIYDDYSITFRAFRFNSALLQPFFPAIGRIGGIVEAHAEMALSENRLSYQGNAHATDLFINTISIDSLSVSMKGGPDNFQLEDLIISSGASTLRASMAIPAYLFSGESFRSGINEAFSGDIRFDNFRISIVSGILPRLSGLDGGIDGELQFAGNLGKPELNGRLIARNISVPENISFLKVAIDSIDLNLDNSVYSLGIVGKRHGSLVRILSSGMIEAWDKVHSNGRIDVPNSTPIHWNADISHDSINASVSADSFQIGGLSSLFEKPLPLRGMLTLSSVLSYSPDSIVIDNEFALRAGSLVGVQIDSLHGKIAQLNENLEINRLSVFRKSGSIEISGTDASPDTIQGMPTEAPGIHADFHRFPLQYIDSTASIMHSDGILEGKVQLMGSKNNPLIRGAITLKNDTIRFAQIKEPLIISDVNILFDGNRITLEKVNGNLGGGSLTGKGQVSLKGLNPQEYQFSFSAQRLFFSVPQVLRLTIDKGNLDILKNNAGILLAGDIQLGESRYTENIRMLQLLEKSRKVLTPPDRNTWTEGIRTKLHINSGDNLWIENNVAKLQANADIGINGVLANPRISGRINAVSGKVGYLGKEFEVKSGSIDFANPTRIDPVINFIAEYNTSVSQAEQDIYSDARSVEQNYVITIQLRGPLSNLQPILLSSSPQLPQQDIITLVTLGRKSGHLLSGPQTQGGANFQTQMFQSLALLSSAQIAGYTEAFSKNLLKLDKVSLQGNIFDMSGESSPILVIEKQVAPRLRLTYSTSVGNYYVRRINLEYQLYKFLYLTTQTDERGDSGADLKLIRRFK